MVKYIDTQSELSAFQTAYKHNTALLFPLFRDRVIHPIQNELVGVFVFIGGDCWVVMQSHNDCLRIPLSVLSEAGGERWAFDTKWAHHSLPIPSFKSIDVAHWLNHWETIPYDTLYHKFTLGGKRVTDTSVYPITRISEEVCGLVKESLDGLNLNPPGFDGYNDLMLPEFAKIERSGIPTTGGDVYSLYNNFTVTGRPTNGFGGVNYSALNRSDGSRDHIVPKVGQFYQWDFDGYHIRLISKLIGEPIEHPSAHEWLGCQYFGKTELTEDEYKESKAITFRQLYGGIDPEIMDIPFYSKTSEYITKMYRDFVVKGYLETRLGRKIPYTKISDHNPQKVFNYYLQALETETNVMIIRKLNQLLEGRRTKLILYVYDSLLIDLSDDEEELIPKIEQILHQVCPTELKIADNYGKI